MAGEWVICDGDNTLWDVESLYDRARENLCSLVEQQGGDPKAADSFQRARDAELYELHGYAAHRFPQSFVDTLKYSLGRDDPELMQRAFQLASEVFRASPPAVANVDVMLRRLRPRYSLALLTAGDPTVQALRLKQFGRTNYFKAVRVVERKSKEALQVFLADHQIERGRAWVVGDSIRSDIEPAVALGVRSIHVTAANWHPVERGNRDLPLATQQATSLLDVCEILGC